ncbi:uncharacterized protein LOC123015683 [Tribolium madens]|uniref:uncharacterized protein LOC123015683 n=1 Tax=Tribolium madens TaxID=41895 RepID=UPI001CF7638E|nr:uncharacterized protein LOC123015683 [Tribolium madens]
MSHKIQNVVLFLIKITAGGWLRDLISSRGWNLGDGVVVHLVDSKLPNTTFLQRHSVIMDYGGLALSVSQALDKEALQVGLGRGYKDYTESAAVSLIIGYKLATMATLAFSAVGALVLKALSVAKIAAVLSMILLVSKLFHHNQQAYVEVEPEFAEIPPEEYFPSASSDYYSYASFPPGIDYVPETFGGNSSDQQVSRRRDASKRRRVPLLTIHQYSIKS